MSMTTQPNPDAELIRLGAMLDEASRKTLALEAALPDDYSDEDRANFDAAFDATLAIVDQIERLSATTVAGLKAKVRAIAWCHSDEPFDDECFNEQGTTNVRLAASVMRDLMAMQVDANVGA
ncbi:hypothetical protein [Methylocella sp.]|uniref:hypothetical protein n=1 Tax=Methylocella sp. TaxID=1978226 RepID=UPI003784FC77